jgi:hypothetical protein
MSQEFDFNQFMSMKFIRRLRRLTRLGVGLWALGFGLWTSEAQTVNVTYYFTDFTTAPAAVERATLTPLAPAGDFNETNLIYGPVSQVTSPSGAVTFSNVVSGYAYSISIMGQYQVTTRTNFFPTGLSGNVNGHDYLGWIVGTAQDGSVIQFAYFYPPLSTNSNGTIYTTNSPSITFSGNGSATNPISGVVNPAGVTNLNYNAITNPPALPTTNGFVTASVTNGFVGASITNGLATTNYALTITNGLATTNYVNTATNGLVTASVTNGLATTNWVKIFADTNGAASNVLVTASNSFVTTSIANGLATTNYVNTATNGLVTASVTNGLATTNWVKIFADTNGAASNVLVTASNSFVTASITNGLATTNYVNAITNGLVTASITNGLATTNYALTAPVAPGIITAGNLPATVTNTAVIAPALVTGILTNNTTGNAATATSASGGWPVTWAPTAITAGNLPATVTNTAPLSPGIISSGNLPATVTNTAVIAPALVTGTLTNNTTGNAATATSASGGWPVTWAPTAITAGNLPATVTNTASVAGAQVTGTLTNNTTGNAATATTAGTATNAAAGGNIVLNANSYATNLTVQTATLNGMVTMTNSANQVAGAISGNGSGLTNFYGLGTNTPMPISAHVTNGIVTWTSP